MLRGLVRSGIVADDFDNQEEMTKHCDYLNHYLKDHAKNYNVKEAENYKVELKYNPENAKYNLKLYLGDEVDPVVVNAHVIKSPEFKRLKLAYPLIRDFLIEEEKELLLETDSETITVTSFAELKKIIEDRGQKGIQLQRFKGLGEMMPQQLWETTMDPETRTLKRVSVEDAMLADRLFDILMGDKVDQRRDFIEANAVYATNIDT